MKKLEKILIVLSLIGIAMKLVPVAGGATITVFGILLLALLYILFGFALFNGIRFRDIFKKRAYTGVKTSHILMSAFCGICLFFLLMGIMFKIQAWLGAAIELFSSSVLTTILFIACLIWYLSSPQQFLKNIFYRAVPLLVIALALYVTPSEKLVHILHSTPDVTQKVVDGRR